MRIHVGPPPRTTDFEPLREGWTPLSEPTPMMLQFIAAPIAVGLALALYFVWSILTPVAHPNDGNSMTVESSIADPSSAGVSPADTLLRIFGGFFLLILVHELLHALSMPDGGMTPQTLIGVWPSRLLFYAAHLGPLSKARFIVVFLMPLMVLTVVPLLTCAILQIGNTLIATISIVNGACACGDLVGAAMIVWQVPRGAQVRNQGWRTWWRLV